MREFGVQLKNCSGLGAQCIHTPHTLHVKKLQRENGGGYRPVVVGLLARGGRGKGFKLQLASYPTLPSLPPPPWGGAAGIPWADRERERWVMGSGKKALRLILQAGWVESVYKQPDCTPSYL